MFIIHSVSLSARLCLPAEDPEDCHRIQGAYIVDKEEEDYF